MIDFFNSILIKYFDIDFLEFLIYCFFGCLLFILGWFFAAFIVFLLKQL